MLEIRDGEDLWQWPPMEIRLKCFRQSTIPQSNSIRVLFPKSVAAKFDLVFALILEHRKTIPRTDFMLMTKDRLGDCCITGDFERFQYFNFELNFLEN